MTNTDILFICLGVIMAIFLVIVFIFDSKKRKEMAPILQAMEEEALNREAEIITAHVEVVDMACGVNMIGSPSYKQPKTIKQFSLIFKDDNGKIIQVNVSEEYYLEFDIGMTGILTLIDGQLSSFELDAEDEQETSNEKEENIHT